MPPPPTNTRNRTITTVEKWQPLYSAALVMVDSASSKSEFIPDGEGFGTAVHTGSTCGRPGCLAAACSCSWSTISLRMLNAGEYVCAGAGGVRTHSLPLHWPNPGAKCGWCTRVTEKNRDGDNCTVACSSTISCTLTCSGTVKSCVPKGFTYASVIDQTTGTIGPKVRRVQHKSTAHTVFVLLSRVTCFDCMCGSCWPQQMHLHGQQSFGCVAL